MEDLVPLGASVAVLVFHATFALILVRTIERIDKFKKSRRAKSSA